MKTPFTAVAKLSIAFLAPVQAAALSCAPMPDPVLILNEIRLVPDEAAVGYGRFSAKSPSDDVLPNTLAAGTAEFEFDGLMFAQGAAIPTDLGTSVISSGCTHEVWCASLGHPIVDTPYLVVFDRAPLTGELFVFSDLCGSSVMLSMPSLDIGKVAACLAGGSCTPADFDY